MFSMGPPLWAGVASDPFAANVISLLHFDGADGSTTFTDQVAGRTWAGDDGVLSTSDSVFGGACVVNNGNGMTGLRLASSLADFYLNGDFSIEFWFKVMADQWAGTSLISISDGGYGICSVSLPFGDPIVSMRRHGLGIQVDNSMGSDGLGGSLIGVWTHVFAGAQGATNYLAINGIMNSVVDGYPLSTAPTSVLIAVHANFAVITPETRIDELRITKGVCRHTASFTPPTAPYPNP